MNNLVKLVQMSQMPSEVQKVVDEIDDKRRKKELPSRVRQLPLHKRPPVHGSFSLGGKRIGGKIQYET